MTVYPRCMSKTIRLLQNAVTEFEAGNFERATTLCTQVIQREPANILALSFGALIEQQRGRHEQALLWIQRAIKLAPADAAAQRVGGAIMLALGRHDEAVAHTRKALELQPNMPGLHRQLGTALTQLERADEAMPILELALRQEQEPDAELLNTVSAALEKACDFVRAEEFARRSLQRQPAYPPAFISLGNALLGQGRPAEAVQMFDQALARNPDDATTRYNRSFALLTSGDFLQGWADYEARWIRPDAPSKRPSFRQPAWDGREIEGRTIVLYSEQGFGDAIHFIRYVPVVAAMGARVLLVCPAALHSLVRHMEGIVQLFGSNEPLPAFDTHAPLMSLPYLLKTTLETVPAEVPYLREPPAETFPLSSSASLKVGLVWAGGDGYRKNRIRSISLDQLLPVLRVPGVQFYSLQCGSPKSDLMKLPTGLQIEDLGSRVRDFGDTAAAMGQLDLVISVCTSTLHLAGALGRPAWGLLSHAPCWRWMLGCSDSPWYPTMTLFRQPKLGDWAGAIAQMIGALRQAAASGNPLLATAGAVAPPLSAPVLHLSTGLLNSASKSKFLSVLPTSLVEGTAAEPVLDIFPVAADTHAPPGNRAGLHIMASPSSIVTNGFTFQSSHSRTGYGVAGAHLLRALQQQRIPVAYFPIGPVDASLTENPKLRAALEAQGSYRPDAPSVRLSQQFDLAQHIGRGPRVGFTIFALDTFTPRELHNLHSQDALMVCSDWARQVCLENGVNSLPIHVVPLGVDRAVFHEQVTPARTFKETTFLQVGKLEPRKGQLELLRAFEAAFTPKDSVHLVLVCGNPFLSREQMEALLKPFHRSPMTAKITLLTEELPSQHEVAGWMAAADCGVFVARAEGWNLEALEMLAMGRDVIATDYSAHRQFLVPENARLIRIDELEPAAGGATAGRWAAWGTAQHDQLVMQLRAVHALRQSDGRQRNVAGLATATQFSWDASASAMVRVLESLV